MRTGACPLQQALTAEAASILKLSHSLARRRGHAQVTPLHVAATLLSSSSSSPASNLLRRACLKSQPHHPASHPLQCRALELCFNVALNRLPTTPPPSSGPLLGSQPSLSNALIAALKRAQAHQRRGCIELQQQQLQQQQQQPLLAIKVEPEQLIISILDDPSVSRVMREAGFSSTCVKNSLEEESSILSQSSPFLLDSHKDIINHGSSLWQSPLFKLSSRQSPPFPVHSSQKEDLNAVLEVMLRKQGRRSNAVVVGDSVSMTEGLVAELMAMVERGEVPDELKAAHFIKFHLSYIHLRLMSRTDVDLKVSDLKRKIVSLASDKVGGGVIIYAGDLRWAIDEEAKGGCGFKPVEHMVTEMGRLLSEFRSSNCAVNNKVLLLATASYQTYMKCQMRQPSLEAQWALQAVVVPSGGLALSLQAPSGHETRLTKLFEYPFQLLGPKSFSNKDDEKLSFCAECNSNFEKEALTFKSEIKGTSCGSTQLPCWLQRQRPSENNKDALLELRKKWSSLCQSLHNGRQSHLYPPFLNQSSIGKNSTFSSYPWWSSSSQSKNSMQVHSVSFAEITSKIERGFPLNIANHKNGILGNWQDQDEPKIKFSEVALCSLKRPGNPDAGITLSLGSALVSDSATSNKKKQVTADREELTRKLQENMPWHSEIIPSIVDSLDSISCESKCPIMLLQGSDGITKRRLSRVMGEHLGGFDDKLIHIDMRKWASKGSSCKETLEQAIEKDSKIVVLIEDIDRADGGFIRFLTDALKVGAFEGSSGKVLSLAGTIFIMTTSNLENYEDESVIKMKLRAEERSTEKDLKRKPEIELRRSDPKRARTESDHHGLDLNLLAEEEEASAAEYLDGEEAAPSDLTNETDCRDPHLPSELLDLATARFTLQGRSSPAAAKRLVAELDRAFEEERSGIGRLVVDEAAEEELAAGAGSFAQGCFERWVREVFAAGLRAVREGGNVRLSVEGRKGNVEEFGFMRSVLPTRIDVE